MARREGRNEAYIAAAVVGVLLPLGSLLVYGKAKNDAYPKAIDALPYVVVAIIGGAMFLAGIILYATSAERRAGESGRTGLRLPPPSGPPVGTPQPPPPPDEPR